MDIRPMVDFLTSLTGRKVEKYFNDSKSLMHWFNIMFYKVNELVLKKIIRNWKNEIYLFTSEYLLNSSVWLVNIDNMPTCVLTESMFEMLMLFKNFARESLDCERLFRFAWYTLLVIFSVYKQIWILEFLEKNF